MDRLEQAQIAYTIRELIDHLSLLLEQQYFNEFEEINNRVIAEVNDNIDRFFSSESE